FRVTGGEQGGRASGDGAAVLRAVLGDFGSEDPSIDEQTVVVGAGDVPLIEARALQVEDTPGVSQVLLQGRLATSELHDPAEREPGSADRIAPGVAVRLRAGIEAQTGRADAGAAFADLDGLRDGDPEDGGVAEGQAG